MKNAVIILMSAILGTLTVAILMTILGRMNRSVEVQSNLPSAVENVIGEMGKEKAFQNEKVAVAACVEKIALLFDTDSEVTVDIMKADMEKGVLAIRVMERFKYPNGNIGKVSCERTVIRDKVEEPETMEYKVRFYMSKDKMTEEADCYKTYTVEEGERIVAPKTPGKEGAVFDCWRDVNDYMADFSRPVQEDLVYYAQWQ